MPNGKITRGSIDMNKILLDIAIVPEVPESPAIIIIIAACVVIAVVAAALIIRAALKKKRKAAGEDK